MKTALGAEECRALGLWPEELGEERASALPVAPTQARALSDSARLRHPALLEDMARLGWSGELGAARAAEPRLRLQIAQEAPQWWSLELDGVEILGARCASGREARALLRDPADPEVLFVHIEEAGEAVCVELGDGARVLVRRVGQEARVSLATEAPGAVAALLPGEAEDAWLREAASARLASGEDWDVAVAAGMLGRLGRLDRGQRAALVQALLRGDDQGAALSAWRWASARGQRQREALARGWGARQAALAVELEALWARLEDEEAPWGPRDVAWVEALTAALLRRDELESVAAVLARGGGGRAALDRQAAAMDARGEVTLGALETLEEVAAVEQLARAAGRDPSQWWASMSLRTDR
jgi:hypothetical protein